MGKHPVFVGSQEVTGNHPDAADILREHHLARLPVDPETGDSTGGGAVEGRALGILLSGGKLSKPAPTLADAKRLYVQEKIKGDINETAKESRIERVMTHLAHAIEVDRPFTSSPVKMPERSPISK